jgi:type I site-specific restriction-modification system R (restriction) subunit
MEQIERTHRYLERIRKMYEGAPYIQNKEYYTDDVYSFFIHCYHIRDWIKELNLLGITSSELKKFIRSHKELRICADLCNGTKHCHIEENKKWTTGQPYIAETSFESSGRNREFTTTKGRFQIISDDVFYDALELAQRCMKLWDDFVEEMKKSASQRLQPTRKPPPAGPRG